MPVGSYATGQKVPASGIYEVRHREHQLPHEVTLLKDETSPLAPDAAQPFYSNLSGSLQL